MDVDLELEMKISRRELRLVSLHEFRLSRKAMEATSHICGTMAKDVTYFLFAQDNLSFIDSRTGTSNSTLYLILEDHYR